MKKFGLSSLKRTAKNGQTALYFVVSFLSKRRNFLPPTKLTSPYFGVPNQCSARRPAAGLGIGLGTTHFSRKDGGRGEFKI